MVLTLKILATADIHSPRYLEMFKRSLKEFDREVDIVILAGDLVERNNVYALKPAYDLILEKYSDKPIIAVFGNEEYRGFEKKYIELYKGFKWLNDSYIVIEINGYSVGVIGTRGALDKPTAWQARNMPGIYKYYSELPSRIASFTDRLVQENVDIIILVTHYGVTYSNLEGEPRHIWPYLASKRFENVIKNKPIDLVIHAHAHNSVRELVYIDGKPVYNVSLPARGRIVYIEYRPSSKNKSKGLDKWFTGVE